MRKFLPILLLLMLCACMPDPPARDPGRLVVEGWIDSGGYPVVMVTSTVNAQEAPQQIEDLSQHLVYLAVVTVKDETDGTEVVLSGRRDGRYLPPYIYTTEHLRGTPGHTYTLKVVYGNRTALSTTTVPEPDRLDRLEVTQASDSLYKVTACISPGPASTGYHRFFTMVEGQDTMYLPSALSGQQQANDAGAVPVMRGWSLTNTKRQPLFYKGETVHIKFCTLGQAEWAYWDSFDIVSTLGANPFFPALHNTLSNMQGAYGYWAGYGVQYGSITIE